MPHLGAAPAVRAGHLLAAGPAGATLPWRRSFHLPRVTGAAALALLRAAGWA